MEKKKKEGIKTDKKPRWNHGEQNQKYWKHDEKTQEDRRSKTSLGIRQEGRQRHKYKARHDTQG